MAAGPLTLLAKKLLALTAASGAHLLIHDRVDVSLAIGASGAHLPETGMETADARRLLGEKLLGKSCHSVLEGCRALQEGADFVTLSPLFPSRSHPEVPALGMEQFVAMRAAIPGPVLALGGINSDNAAQAATTGAYGVALIRGILDTENPEQAAVGILSQLNICK